MWFERGERGRSLFGLPQTWFYSKDLDIGHLFGSDPRKGTERWKGKEQKNEKERRESQK